MSWTHTRARIANAKRRDPSADVTDLQRQLKAERLADHIAAVVAAAPPLTDEQRDKLALLLRAGAPPGRPAHEEPIPAANPVSGSHLPHTETEGQVRVPAGGAGQ